MTVILGLESSCDETAAAVVTGSSAEPVVRSNVIATQHDLHRRYAGVVPEIASRAHVERLTPVVETALAEAGVALSDLDAVAVAHRPGLIGSLLAAVSAAKGLSWGLEVPLIGVDHVVAHLFAGLLHEHREAPPPAPVFPALGLVVSGGHSSLFVVRAPFEPELVGRTIDDAIGEAYDKAATVLELGYPGGPLLDALAAEGDDHAHDFPIARLAGDTMDFSFSGLKTSFLYRARGMPKGRGADVRYEREAKDLSRREQADLAASFQRAAVRAVMRQLARAHGRYGGRTLLVGGGVSANSRLRTELTTFAVEREIDLRLPRMAHCLDNAAMIAGLAHVRHEQGRVSDLGLCAAAR